MPRLPLLPLESISENLDHPTVGHATNLHRVLGYNNRLLAAWKLFASAMRDDCIVPRLLRELVTLRVAQLGTSDYMWVEHVPMALAAGVTAEQIAQLADWRASAIFSLAERTVIRMAEAVSAGHLTESDFDLLTESFTPQEIVELILTASFYSLVPRFTQALDIQPEMSA